MNNKKWYTQAQITVVTFNQSDVIRTSGEDPAPTAIAVEGEAIGWQAGWN